MNKLHYEFPSRLSQAIIDARLHLIDLIENNKHFKYDGSTWHNVHKDLANNTDTCYICLAGSLIIKSGHHWRKPFYGLGDMTGNNYALMNKFYAIDKIRRLANIIFGDGDLDYRGWGPTDAINNCIYGSIHSYYSYNHEKMQSYKSAIRKMSRECNNLKNNNPIIYDPYRRVLNTDKIFQIYHKYGM